MKKRYVIIIITIFIIVIGAYCLNESINSSQFPNWLKDGCKHGYQLEGKIHGVGLGPATLENQIAGMNTILESDDGDIIIFYKDGYFKYYPAGVDLDYYSYVKCEYGTWDLDAISSEKFMMLTIKLKVFKFGLIVPCNFEVRTQFYKMRDEEIPFNSNSKVKFLDKEFHFYDGYDINSEDLRY